MGSSGNAKPVSTPSQTVKQGQTEGFRHNPPSPGCSVPLRPPVRCGMFSRRPRRGDRNTPKPASPLKRIIIVNVKTASDPTSGRHRSCKASTPPAHQALPAYSAAENEVPFQLNPVCTCLQSDVRRRTTGSLHWRGRCLQETARTVLAVRIEDHDERKSVS